MTGHQDPSGTPTATITTLHLFPREPRNCPLDTVLFRQLIDEMEPTLYSILSGYIFHVMIPLSNAKHILECRRPPGGTVSPIPLPSFFIISLVPTLYARKDRQWKGSRAEVTVITLRASNIWGDHITVEGTTGNLPVSHMLYSYKAAGHGFLSFSLPSHTTAHNSPGIHMKEMRSDCHQQLFCFCAISVFLSLLARWPRAKACSLIWPPPLRSQLGWLSW